MQIVALRLEKGARFCPECGAPVEPVQPEKTVQNPGNTQASGQDTTSRWKNNIRTDTGITEEESDSYYCSGYRSSCIYYRWRLIIWDGWSCMAEEQCSVKD